MQVANVNVPVKVTGRRVSITEAIKNYSVSKVENLHLDYPRIMEAHVILDVEKHRHFAEVVLHCRRVLEVPHSSAWRWRCEGRACCSLQPADPNRRWTKRPQL